MQLLPILSYSVGLGTRRDRRITEVESTPVLFEEGVILIGINTVLVSEGICLVGEYPIFCLCWFLVLHGGFP